jgi:single-strand DNA-binding protein
MSLPTLTGVGRLTADTELRITTVKGTSVCRVKLAFNQRKKNEAGEWEDGAVFYIDGTAFGSMAENIVQSPLSKGHEVLISGRLQTQQWNDKNTGEKRSAPELVIEAIGASMAHATVAITKTTKAGAHNLGPDDSWANATPAPAGVGAGAPAGGPSVANNFDDEPPF